MKKYKVLFVSSLVTSSNSGGAQCSKRNFESLVEIFGAEKVCCYSSSPFNFGALSLKLLFSVIKNTISLRVNGIMKDDEAKIINIINSNDIPYVFIDYSGNGRLIKLIKHQTNAKVISFFHNCELSLAFQQLCNGDFTGLIRMYSCYFGEKLTCKYADGIIGLNKRDEKLIQKIYSRVFDSIIPISLKDRDINTNSLIPSIDLLFVGSNFYPNLHGIKWFIKNVLPYTNKKLVIIGRNLRGTQIEENGQVKVLSDVDDLTAYYKAAKIVIAPIFKGAGMKVKTAEAMLYNKIILGTSEAFQGYVKTDGMIECNSAADFIEMINKDIFNDVSSKTRECYLNNYSFGSTLFLFSEIFKRF